MLDCWVRITTKSTLLQVSIFYLMKTLSPFVDHSLHGLIEETSSQLAIEINQI